MEKTIFYSWQSDLSNASNRSFIEQALEKAAKAIANDDAIEVSPVVDRDTLGISGSPDISSTIFGKISKADVFVADISIINSEHGGRNTPNPNVLIELGYALNCLGYERVILIYNLAFAPISDLPFDLQSKRVLTYNSPKTSADRSATRTALQKTLERALRASFDSGKHVEIAPTEHPAITAIANVAANRNLILRTALKEILSKLLALIPERKSKGGNLEGIIAAINSSQLIVADFLAITEVIVQMKDNQALLEIYHWFGQIFIYYRSDGEYVGRSDDGDYDYMRFIGHELLTSLVAQLLKEKDFTQIKRLLEEPIPVAYLREEGGPGEVFFFYASEWLPAIRDLNKVHHKISYHGHLLNERHTQGLLAKILPMKLFTATDYFLYIYNNVTTLDQKNIFYHWRPWTIPYLSEAPLFLKQAERKVFAEELTAMLGLNSVEELSGLIRDLTLKVRSFFEGRTLDLFLRAYRFENIGTK